MNKEQAESKVRKLLALANRPGTPAEGASALARAKALAERHGLKVQRKGTARRVPKPKRPVTWTGGPTWDDLLAKAEAAQAHAKDRTEEKRQASMKDQAFSRGYASGLAGKKNAYPYARHVVFGVNLLDEWKRGYEKGQKEWLSVEKAKDSD